MMKVSAPLSIVQLWPKFTKTDKGWLMTGLDSDINNGTQKMSLQIQYQSVEGLQLPERIEIQITATNLAALIELNFSAYQLTKR